MPSESGSEVGLYGSRGQRDASRLVKDSKLGAIRGSRILPLIQTRPRTSGAAQL